MDWIDDAVDAGTDEAVDTRRWLHVHPEVAFEEHATTATITQRLEQLGLQPEPCPTATGAVATLEGGRPGRTVLVRADIDGLPVQEETDVPYASAIDGCMHACGHDAHVAILLSTARLLAERAEELPGRYVFVFQPAEEKVSGAKAMLDGGLFDGRDVDTCIGCHVTPVLPVGMMALKDGIAMSASTNFRVHLDGSGGHGAEATRRGNVVLAISDLVPRLPGIVTDMSFEGSKCACNAGVVRAGSAPNVVPRHAELEATLRTFTAEQAVDARAALDEVCREVAADFEVRATVEILSATPAVDNDPAATAAVRAAAEPFFGPGMVLTIPPVSPSDDMSEFLRRAPGCYFYVGAGSPEHPSGPHHSPTFDLDEGCLRHGIAAMAAGAIALAAPLSD